MKYIICTIYNIKLIPTYDALSCIVILSVLLWSVVLSDNHSLCKNII